MANDFEILRLKGSYETFGIVTDFLAGIEPFARYDLGNFARVLQYQLAHGDHLAAVTKDRVVGYCGWLQTTTAAADAWLTDDASLSPLAESDTADTVVLTIVAARDRSVLFALVASAHRLNPYDRVYFKRERRSGPRASTKRFVDGVAGARSISRGPRS